ncbi:hypothetical protein [Arthrobacter sp.]|uniref:hypothetical protein n=1 Tax=Arthrobacter sp. TaxID=1667 RepID=UPI003A9270A4
MKNASSPIRVLALWLAVLMVLAIAAVVTITLVNQKVFGPERQVSTYFGLLQDGEGEQALGLLDPAAPKGNALLLDGKALQSAVEPIEDFTVQDAREVTDGKVEVTTTYQVGGQEHSTVFHLTRTGRDWLFFDRWAFAATDLPQITVTADTTNEVQVNGEAAPLAKGAARLPVFLPAVVDASYRDKYFQGAKRQLVVDSASTAGTDGLALTTKPTRKLVQDVDAELHKYLDGCARQQVLKPAGCPLSYDTEARVSSDTIHWKITRYPTVEIGPYDGGWVLRPLEVGTSLNLVEQDLMTGVKTENTVEHDFGFTAKLDISGESVTVTPVVGE